jgi:hypothetical protein
MFEILEIFFILGRRIDKCHFFAPDLFRGGIAFKKSLGTRWGIFHL